MLGSRSLMATGPIVVLIVVSMCRASDQLPQNELAELRGGAAQAKKCTRDLPQDQQLSQPMPCGCGFLLELY